MGYIVFHELTAINVINLYSNQMFKQMNKDGAGFTPRQGTYALGVATVISGLISIEFVKHFGRRTLLIWGHIGIAGAHGLCAYFNYSSNNNGIIAMIILFDLIYYNSSGPLAWVYAAETLIDVALGIALTILYFSAFSLSVVSPILMQDDMLGPTVVFMMFSAFSFAGAIYAMIFIKETIHLNDREKKTLYLTKKQKRELFNKGPA